MRHQLFHKDSGLGHHQHDHHHPEETEKQAIIPPKQALRFEDFLLLFPPMPLPISLNSDSQRLIAEVNDPLHAVWVTHFILDEKEVDEFTEFMPCFSLPDTEKFHAIVYWQASLEGNAFFLATFGKGGHLIDHRLLAGTLYLEDGMTQLVCSIGADWSIHRAEGRLGSKGEIIKDGDPKTTFMQITLEGEVVED